ncbi:hypothetical protein [uncultured Rikenella sp.]|uniref:DUF4906 domain-containing protein n=1 Tax=uncultured Rikenella sp. TaxID=368003 RepID=UPI0025CD923D|nr:hypothetical protein [uncultured Rikenella sp.]
MSYISRFILWTGMLSVVLLAGGCRRHTLDGNAGKDSELVDAMLILRCNELETRAATREEQERQVNDLNLFFVHKSYPSPTGPEVRHYYFSSVDVAKHLKLTNIRLGKYRMYAVANAGGSLCSDSHHPTDPTAVGESFCSMTEQQIKALVVSSGKKDLTQADGMLMSSVDENMEIKRAKHPGDQVAEGSIVPISIVLERKVAKFQFSYELGGDMVGKMKITSIGARYAPKNVAVFEKSTPSSSGDFLAMDVVRPLRNFVADGSEGYGGNISKEDPIIFYLQENMQGDVSGITDPRDRNGHKAPKYASYIFLDGTYKESENEKAEQYGFSIFLGNNTTDNFDVEGNAYYHVHLELNGLDPDDIRISSLKINVLSAFPVDFKLNEPQEAIVEIICSNYFNDELQLVCTAPGARGQHFDVFPLIVKPDGTEELGPAFDDVSGTGDGWYDVLETDDQPGERRVKCKVVYTQTMSSGLIQMNLMLRSRYGTATVVDRKNIIVE